MTSSNEIPVLSTNEAADILEQKKKLSKEEFKQMLIERWKKMEN